MMLLYCIVVTLDFQQFSPDVYRAYCEIVRHGMKFINVCYCIVAIDAADASNCV